MGGKRLNYAKRSPGRSSGTGATIADDPENHVTHADPIALRDARLVAEAWKKIQHTQRFHGAFASRAPGNEAAQKRIRSTSGVFRFVRSLVYSQLQRMQPLSEKQRSVLLKILDLEVAPEPTPLPAIAAKVLAPPPLPFCDACGVRHAAGRHIP